MAKALRAEGFTGRLMFGSAAADSLFLSRRHSARAGRREPGVHPDPGQRRHHRDLAGQGEPGRLVPGLPVDVRHLRRLRLVRRGRGRPGRRGRSPRPTAPTATSLRTAIETTRLDGLSGPIRLTPANHSGLMPQAVTLLVAANGRWRLAS